MIEESIIMINGTVDDEYKNLKEDFHNKNCWGLLVSIDAKKCNNEYVKSKSALEYYVHSLCDLIEMKRFGECQIVHFGQDEKVCGYSLIQLIETSLISGHFAENSNGAYIDIFSCKWFDPEVVTNFTKEFFEAEQVTSSVLLRA